MASTNENESFNKHYNKELKVSEDEIPIVLLELNESALAFITREQFEKALLLLQKAHGVLDVVDIGNCKRDQMIALEIFLNMALCYQKIGQLEECSLCLETCIEHLGADDYKQALHKQSIAMRVMKMKLECKLRMQLCAIYSQLHRHKEALEQAYTSAKLGNLIVQDQINLCQFISMRVDFENINKNNGYKQAMQNEESTQAVMIDNLSSYSDDAHLQNNFEEQSMDSISHYQTHQAFTNNLEESISLVERSAKKLLPIYRELLKRLVQFKPTNKSDPRLINKQDDDIDSDLERLDTDNPQDHKSPEKKYQLIFLDMRHMLGFLNQSEWVTSLNIGNIMQISPIQHEDLICHRRNEQEITRDAFLESVSFMIVAYFCVSTEIRFIIQLKEEINKMPGFDIGLKTKESEYWHAKSLEVACSFLPSDCPLLNHVLLSYQKHHAPSQTSIPENQATEETLEVMKPLIGIENNKFQPIIKRLQNVNIQLSPISIQTAQKTVQKLLKQIEPIQSGYLMQNLSPIESNNAQNLTGNKTPNNTAVANGVHKNKINKIIKFEKIMKKFCRDVGIDKRTLMAMMLGKDDIATLSKNDPNSSSKDLFNQPKYNTNMKDSVQINTGQAAQMAYNNIISAIDPERNISATQSGMRVRTTGYNKSRNGNFSLSENRDSNGNGQSATVPSLPQPALIQHRTSIGDAINTKNYESDTTLLLNDHANNLNENSFTEQMLDKNKLTYSREPSSSIVSTVMSKRQQSIEKISHRPRSSKGNRISSTSNNQIPLILGQQQFSNTKFNVNKNEERTKSQQQSRTISSTNKHKQQLGADNFSKILQQNLVSQQNQTFKTHGSDSKGKVNNMLNGLQMNENNQQLNQENGSSGGKKSKVNYEDLKKYLMKEYQQQKVQNKLSNFYLKQEEVNVILSKNKKQSQGRSGKHQIAHQNAQILNQQQKQTSQQHIYMAQAARPTSVGNVGSMKKRDKNKALMQELLLNGALKQKLSQGTPLVGFLGNHNLSVNITNIAGNVNGLRQQQFFEEDIKQIGNTSNGFIRGVGNPSNLIGIESIIPNQKVNSILNQGNLSFDARRKSQPT